MRSRVRSSVRPGRLTMLLFVSLTVTAGLAATSASAATPPRTDVLPSLQRNLVAFYDFEHPNPGNPAQELDQGLSSTTIDLVNGGAAMRVPDGAYPASSDSIQTMQVNPTVNGNDDWKAGIYSSAGVTHPACVQPGSPDHDHGLVQDHRSQPEPELRHR